MLSDDQKKVWDILKDVKLKHKLDINLDDYTQEQRTVCHMSSPDGIYSNLAEMIETELEIPFEEWCDSMGYDSKKSIYKGVE